jgi:CRP-like cAMP-binding protein
MSSTVQILPRPSHSQEDPGLVSFLANGESLDHTVHIEGGELDTTTERKTTGRLLKRGTSKHHMEAHMRSERMISKKTAVTRQNLIGNLLAVVEEYGIRRKKTDFHAHSTFPVFVPTNPFRRRWDIFTLLVLIYVILVTPFSIAFLDPPDQTIAVFDRIVDGVFWIDIILNFRTAWVDVEGHMCFEWKECAVSYAQGWLFVDVISCLPYDSFTASSDNENSTPGEAKSLMLLRALKILKLTKLLRVFRSSRILKRMEQQMAIKFGVLKLMKFILVIVTVAHWMACVYYLAGTMSEPASQHESWINSHAYPEHYTFWDMYVLAMYWAIMTITTIGYGDVPSGTTAERVVSIFCMILGACLYSYIVGTVTTVVQGLDISRRAFEDKMDSINDYMTLSCFPTHLRRRIRAYCFYQRDTKSFLPQERDLYASVSPALRSMCAYYKYNVLLKRVPYFAHAPTQVISELALLLKHAIYMPGECVMKAGEVGHVMYFMYKGRAHLEMIGKDNDPVILGLLTDGTHFGERGMLFSARRLHTVRCLSYCDTCIINGDDYTRLMRFHPDVKAEVRRMVVRKMWAHLSKSGKLISAFQRASKAPRKKAVAMDLNIMQTKIYELQELLAKQMRFRELELERQKLEVKAITKTERAKHENEKRKLRRESQRLTLSVEELRTIVEGSGTGITPTNSPRNNTDAINSMMSRGGVAAPDDVHQVKEIRETKDSDNITRPGVVSDCGTEEDHLNMQTPRTSLVIHTNT